MTLPPSQPAALATPASSRPDTPPGGRRTVIAAILMTLFLGAMDAMAVIAAMPTIVADLGGLDLYSWVYSTYFLARAVSLPIFGKLSDLFETRILLLIAVGAFVVSSVLAACAGGMLFLIAARVLQGIGSGGIFALVYVALSDISTPRQRARTLSLASSIWGIASVLGPSLGGFIVAYLSWRWIFWINLPLGVAAMLVIARYLVETRAKKARVHLDIGGVALLTATILSLLLVFMLGGVSYPWNATPVLALAVLTLVCGVGFVLVERRAVEPILSLRFFALRGFRTGNGAVFCSSFVIFAMFAYAPLYIQGALAKSPLAVGLAMLSLSLGWSLGSITLGQVMNRTGARAAAVGGAGCLIAGCGWALTFGVETGMTTCFFNFLLIGVGMGFVTLATLLVVQAALDATDLGVATSSHQFARTLGGTVGIGVCGGFVTQRLAGAMDQVERMAGASSGILPEGAGGQMEHLLRPEIQSLLAPEVRTLVQTAILEGVGRVFWTVTIAAAVCLAICLALPAGTARGSASPPTTD